MSSGVGLVARRLAWPVLITLILAAVFAFGILPTRSYLDRRQQVAAAEQRLAEIEQANAEAKARREKLQTDAEIEHMAREQFGMVKRGEEAYKIVPPPEPPAEVPDVWPFGRLNRRLG